VKKLTIFWHLSLFDCGSFIFSKIFLQSRLLMMMVWNRTKQKWHIFFKVMKYCLSSIILFFGVILSFKLFTIHQCLNSFDREIINFNQFLGADFIFSILHLILVSFRYDKKICDFFGQMFASNFDCVCFIPFLFLPFFH
jgi:hypothetical protein